MRQETIRLQDRRQAEAWVGTIVAEIHRPCVVLLNGDLGAGKTQFVSWFVSALGGEESASPTFAIHHQYASPSGPIDHLDLYRLQDEGELESAGFWDLLDQPQALMFVEWSDRLTDDVWPKHWRRLNLRLFKEGAGESRRAELRIQEAAG